MAESMSIGCQTCGHSFLGADVQDWLTQRTPCPACDDINYLVQITMTEVAPVIRDSYSVEASSAVVPGPLDRVAHIKRLLVNLDEVNTAEVDWTSAARLVLRDLYVNLWNLREASVAAGVADHVVDLAIKSDFDVQRAMDLGNVAKHGPPLRRPWSGQQPSFGDLTVKFEDEVGAVDELVFFDADQASGVDIAVAAATSWERFLAVWGLI